MNGETRDEPTFDWAALVPRLVHPLRVEIIEALLWIDLPLSAAQLVKVFENERGNVSVVACHVRKLAEVEAIVPVARRQVRGAVETFYSFPD